MMGTDWDEVRGLASLFARVDTRGAAGESEKGEQAREERKARSTEICSYDWQLVSTNEEGLDWPKSQKEAIR